MKKKFIKLLNLEDASILKTQQLHEVNNIIAYKNIEILTIIFFISIFNELILIFFNDLKKIETADASNIGLYRLYLTGHTSIMIIGIICVVIFLFFVRGKKGSGKSFLGLSTLYSVLCVGIGMSILAVVDVLDYQTIGFSVVFIFNIFIASILMKIAPPLNIILLVIPTIVYAYSGFKFIQDQEQFSLIISNTMMVVICMIVFNTLTYLNHRSNLIRQFILKEKNEQLVYMAQYDMLTGLQNRRYFQDNIQLHLKNSQATKSLSVLAIGDIDLFKNINDTYGHPIGDAILKEFSKMILNELSDEAIVARWGGEEFIILLPECNLEEGYNKINQLRARIENNAFNLEGNSIKITLSFGVTTLSENTEKAFATAYKNGDAALYKAKENGRNRVEKI